MSFAAQVKNSLLHIISSMVSHPEDFCMHPRTDFSRNRKLDFSTLLQLIISMEAGTVRDELLKFFSYDKDTASNSAFFQQRAKLTDNALPYLFQAFNSLYPCSLYKNKYQLLAADGSSFTFTRNPLDGDSYFAPTARLLTVIIRSILFLFLTSFQSGLWTAWFSRSEKRTSSGLCAP